MEVKINISWWWFIAQVITILFKIYGWVDFSWWVIFITLKLIGVIDWSWIWVLSPLWIGTIIGIIALVLLLHIKY